MLINNIPIVADLEDILQELKSQLDINGINLLNTIKPTTDDVMVSCPYHKDGQERKPSMGIRKTDGLCHCFTCSETHSLQEMITHCFGYYDDIAGTFGWNWILKNFLTISVEERKDVELDFERNTDSILHINNNNFIPDEQLDKYRFIHPYMYERGLTDEIIEKFDIGYDKDTKCITFPIKDIEGNCLFVARRSVNSKFFNYPNGVEKPVYGLYELKQISKVSCKEKTVDGCNVVLHFEDYPSEIIVCESMLDALKCWVFGKYAVALNGLGNELQFKQLNKLPCRKFILATDIDGPGMRARSRIAKNLKNKLVTEYVWDPARGKDINDLSEDDFNNITERLFTD